MIYRSGVISVCILIALLNCSHSVTAYISEGVSDETGRQYALTHEELSLRRKIVDTYLSETGGTEQDWVETYHSRFGEDNFKTADKFDDMYNEDDIYETNTQKYPSNLNEKEDVTKNPSGLKDAESVFSNAKEDHINKVSDEPSKTLHIAKCKRDRSYMVRWVAKLVRKIESNRYGSMCLSFSPELLIDLKQISEDFDIVTVDELVSSLISNSTFQDGSYRINIFPSFDNLLYYSGIIGGVLLICYVLHYFIKNHPYIPPLIVLILSVFVYCHARKFYRIIMAQKHATMSRVRPENCVSTLTHESGVIDHIKEFIRHSFYREDCQKYYEAVMIDPSEEISIPVVIADLVSSVFLQFLKPLASTLNYFVKEILYDMSFTQKLALIPVFIFIFYIFLLLLRYKINLPLFMGSFEPTSVPRVGSHVEDLKPVNSSGSPIVNVNIFPNGNNSEHSVHKNDICKGICHESNKIYQLNSDIQKRELSRRIKVGESFNYNEGEIVDFLCDKPDCKNFNSCSQMQINSDKGSNNDSMGDISDLSSCKRCKCTEQTLHSGDKNKDGLKKQIPCYTHDLKENSNSLGQMPINLDKKSDSDSIGDISSKTCNEQTQQA